MTYSDINYKQITLKIDSAAHYCQEKLLSKILFNDGGYFFCHLRDSLCPLFSHFHFSFDFSTDQPQQAVDILSSFVASISTALTLPEPTNSSICPALNSLKSPPQGLHSLLYLQTQIDDLKKQTESPTTSSRPHSPSNRLAAAELIRHALPHFETFIELYFIKIALKTAGEAILKSPEEIRDQSYIHHIAAQFADTRYRSLLHHPHGLSPAVKIFLFILVTLLTGIVPGLIVSAILAKTSYTQTGSIRFFDSPSQRLMRGIIDRTSNMHYKELDNTLGKKKVRENPAIRKLHHDHPKYAHHFVEIISYFHKTNLGPNSQQGNTLIKFLTKHSEHAESIANASAVFHNLAYALYGERISQDGGNLTRNVMGFISCELQTQHPELANAFSTLSNLPLGLIEEQDVLNLATQLPTIEKITNKLKKLAPELRTQEQLRTLISSSFDKEKSSNPLP
ncbi:MAG: hypothetical protein HY939_07945 [Gammaproteobacteria bacterium]|nr:hypothetical protein [Gammaproteobacteria bacterium]